MDSNLLGLIELLLVAGGVLGFAIWELVSVRRSIRRDAERASAAEAAATQAQRERGDKPSG